MRFALVVLVAVGITGCSAGPTSVEELPPGKAYRAMREMQAATSVGVVRAEYGRLLQQLATEILILQEAPGLDRRDAQVVVHYSAALGVYKDALSLWDQQISDVRYSKVIPEGKTVVHERVVGIPEKYGIPIERRTVYGQAFELIPNESIQLLWDRARGVAARGDSLLLAQFN